MKFLESSKIENKCEEEVQNKYKYSFSKEKNKGEFEGNKRFVRQKKEEQSQVFKNVVLTRVKQR